MKQILNISALIILLFIASCSSSKNDIDSLNIIDTSRGTLSAKIDGKDFSTAYPFVTAELVDNNPFSAIAIGGVVTTATDTTGIALALVFTDLATIENKEFKGNNPIFEFWAAGEYNSNVGTSDRINASSGELKIASVILTKVDTVNKRLSGTFSFTAEDGDTNKNYSITEGKFDNIEY